MQKENIYECYLIKTSFPYVRKGMVLEISDNRIILWKGDKIEDEGIICSGKYTCSPILKYLYISRKNKKYFKKIKNKWDK